MVKRYSTREVEMDDRIKQELKLLKKEIPNLRYREEGRWIFIPAFRLPENIWNKSETAVCFQILPAYPGEPPDGFYIEGGIRLKDTNEKPDNYEEPTQTPFEGTWGRFSWQQNNSWRATSDLTSGGNLLNFVRTFKDRLSEGK